MMVILRTELPIGFFLAIIAGRSFLVKPNICHKSHQCICGDKICHVEKFQISRQKTLPEAQRTQGIASKLELSLQLMVAPLALVPNLATRWRHLHELKNWPQDGATGISSKFGHQMAPLA